MLRLTDLSLLITAGVPNNGFSLWLQKADFVLLFTAIVGVILAILNARKKNIPFILVLVHGLFSVIGMILFVIAIATASLGIFITVSCILFLVDALGGFVLYSHRLRKQPLPGAMVVVHGLIVVLGFAIQTPYWWSFH